MKIDLKKKAIKLRKAGNSYNLIRAQVSVSKSTLSLWLQDIPYTPNKLVQNRIRGSILQAQEWVQERKHESLESARKEAIKELGILSKRDLYILGIGIYIGEGSKTRNQIRVINSDPQVICLAIRWFEDIFGLNNKHFSITIHLYPDNNIKDAIAFWSKITGIPFTQFGKVQIDKRLKKGRKHGMLQHGTAHLYVTSRGEKRFGAFLFRKIQALIEEAYRQIN